MRTVVITGAGTATCQGVIKALRLQTEIPVRIVVADCDQYVAGRYLADAFELVPFANDPAFTDRVIEITRKHNADLLVPIVDMEFLGISERRADFPCTVGISSVETLTNCLEKDRTYTVLDELGLMHPRVYPASDRDESAYPKFIKPRIGRASLDTYRANNRAELELALAHVKDPLVTEFVEGVEMTIDTLSSMKGAWIGGCVRVREMTKSGVSTKGLVVYNGTVLGQARQIVERLGITGPACLQCFNTESGPVWFEVNPRFGGGTILSVAAGFNSPLFLLKSVLGMSVDGYAPTPVARMMRFWQEVFIDGRGNQIIPGESPTASARRSSGVA